MYSELNHLSSFWAPPQSDLVIQELQQTLAPVIWHTVDEKYADKYPAAALAWEFNMRDGWTHGAVKPSSMDFTAFTFAGPKVEASIRVFKILEFIIPFLSEAYNRVLKNTSKLKIKLTSRD